MHLFAVDVCANEIVVRDMSQEQNKLMTIAVPMPSGEHTALPELNYFCKIIPRQTRPVSVDVPYWQSAQRVRL